MCVLISIVSFRWFQSLDDDHFTESAADFVPCHQTGLRPTVYRQRRHSPSFQLPPSTTAQLAPRFSFYKFNHFVLVRAFCCFFHYLHFLRRISTFVASLAIAMEPYPTSHPRPQFHRLCGITLSFLYFFLQCNSSNNLLSFEITMDFIFHEFQVKGLWLWVFVSQECWPLSLFSPNAYKW